MEFKGTKEKWEIEKSSDYHEDCRVDYIPKIGLHIDEYADVESDESEYNLLLISKAPEMLEMLQSLLNESEDIVHSEIKKNIEKLIKEATEL
jgi:hypothetical protein